MAISFDDSDSAQGTSVSSLSAPAWTNAGDFLIAGMGWSSGTPPNYTSMKWGGSGGTTLTQIGSTLVHNTYYKLALARLVAPNTGSYQLYGAVSGTTDELCVGGMTYSGVDQTTPVGTSASNSGTGSSPQTATVNVTAAVNDVVVSMAYGGGNGTCTIAVGSGQTMRWEQENIGGSWKAAGTQSEETATGTTVTMSEVFTQGDPLHNYWGIIGVAVKPSAGASDITPNVSDSTTITDVATVYNSTAHRYWRLLCLAINPASNNITIGEVELRESVGGSDATGSGTASASSEFSGAESAAKAFDNSSSTCWTSSGKAPQWLKYDFGAGNDKDIVQIAVTSRNDTYYAQTPTIVVVQYSDDNSSWTTVSRISTGTWSQNETKAFTLSSYSLSLSNSGAYRYYRIYINYNRDKVAASFCEIELRSSLGGSDETGSGTASADTEYDANHAASKAVDNDTSTKWASTDSDCPHWWKYDFGNGVTKEILEIPITSRNDSYFYQSPIDFFIQGSNNNSDWVDLAYGCVDTGWTQNQTKTFTIDTELSDITPNVSDSTTITDVVTVDNSTVPLDTSDTCAVSEAVSVSLLSDISLSDSVTCDDTGAATSAHRHWRIYCQSITSGWLSCGELELRESEGGSDVTGSGTASASSTYSASYLPAYAFDNNSGTNWEANGTAYGWIAYDFGAGQEKAIVEISWLPRASYPQESPLNFDVQFSDDGASWTTAFSIRDLSAWTNGVARVFNAGDSYGADFAPREMTDADSPSPYVISQSTEYNSTYGGWRCFSFVANDTYYWETTTTSGWLKVDLGEGNERSLSAYGIKIINQVARAPKNFTIQGSNNDSDWTTLDTQTNITSWANWETKYYNLGSPSSAYRYYKLDVTQINGGPVLNLTELFLFSDFPSAGTAAVIVDIAIGSSVFDTTELTEYINDLVSECILNTYDDIAVLDTASSAVETPSDLVLSTEDSIAVEDVLAVIDVEISTSVYSEVSISEDILGLVSDPEVSTFDATLVSEYSVTYCEQLGSIVWGHDTGVDEPVVKNFQGNWTGTGSIGGSDDEEVLEIETGTYMESENIQLGTGNVVIALNKYRSGTLFPVRKYKTAAAEGDLAGLGWSNYTDQFYCEGWVKVRLEAA